jgi:hypothetical protein
MLVLHMDTGGTARVLRGLAWLAKVLAHSIAKQPHGAVDGVVHFNPTLIEKGLGENGPNKRIGKH